MKKILYVLILFILSISAIYSQSQWRPLGSPTGGSIHSIIEKDGHIFTAAGQYWSTGAVYRSDDNGKTWELKINNLPANFTVLDLTCNDTYIYTASSAGGVYRSSDYGESWEFTGLSAIIYTIHADGNNIYAGSPAGVFRSQNNGNTWKNISNGLDDHEVYIICTVDNYVFAGTSNGVYRSLNGGNWVEVNTGINSQYRYINSFVFNEGNLFTGLYNGLYKSTNFGNTWTNITNGSDGAYSLNKFDNKIYTTNYFGIHYSTNNGQNWITINNPHIMNQYLMDAYIDGNLIITGENELTRSEDHGNSWSFSSAGIANLNTGPIIKWNNVFYTTSENIIYKSFDNGLTWTASESLPLYTFLTDFFPYENYIFGASRSGSSVRSLDGETWETLEVLASEFTSLNGYLFACRTGQYTGIIFRSSDLGLTWESLTTPMVADVSGITAFNGELYIGGFGGLYKSNDNGNSWIPIVYTTSTDPRVRKMYVHNNYLILYDDGEPGLFRSSNGIDWEFYNNDIQYIFYSYFESYGEILFAATYNDGILISHDNGETWQSLNEGLPLNSNGGVPVINNVYAIDNQLFASVANYSLWNTSLDAVPVELLSFTADYNNGNVILNWQTATETNNRGFEIQRFQDSKITRFQDWEVIGFVEGKGTTSEQNNYSFGDKNLSGGNYSYRLKQIDFDGSFEYSKVVEVEVITPVEFVLEQNYPNPFNPSTVIRYHLPFETKVSIKVYNVLGKEVASLVNETKEAGIHDIEFNNNGQFSSGAYFYTIKTEGPGSGQSFTDTKKFILLK